ncbi:MAG: hypothetical protein AUG51_18250 [Acidobacteria bacterium 13_1_20CM_3_53_8]|nr:MAG: hypothetical protein AUG51_18250 [Acidobacteria bacterium 13_1_20CM_3_53_8]
MSTHNSYDVCVVGAGVFGAWSALSLRRAGLSVLLLDAHGPGNSRSSSGGESRIIRMGYGADEIYTRSALHSLARWQELFEEAGQQLFHSTGVLWMAREDDSYSINTLATLRKVGVQFEKLSRAEIAARYPQINVSAAAWGIFEPDSGVVMARRAVQAVTEEAIENGARYSTEAVVVPVDANSRSRLEFLGTQSGESFWASTFVFACGSWLPKIFPDLLSDLIHPTRQEVFFFGVPAGDNRFAPPQMPVWIDFNDLVYGIPELDFRGFKLAIDRHGAEFDPESGERTVTAEGLAAVRAYLKQRLPALKDAPVIETRVCQYENTSNGDFLIDRHPELENVWIVGGGSGHGFKHGPSVGEYVAARVMDEKIAIEPRFTFATKDKIQRRAVY